MPSKIATRQINNPYTLAEFERAGKVAMYYGFNPIIIPNIVKNDPAKAKQFKRIYKELDKLDRDTLVMPPFLVDEKINLLASYLDKEYHQAPAPLMSFHKHTNFLNNRSRNIDIGLDIVGVHSSIAEALIIKTSFTILAEEGFKDLVVEINYLGDEASLADCERELSVYIRKHLNEMSAELRQSIKKDPFELLRASVNECDQEIQDNAPTPMNALSEKSRSHFKEVLEYLETLNIPYTINPRLMGNKNYVSHTIFKIKSNGEKTDNKFEAIGVSYHHLARRAGLRKDLNGIGVSISYRPPSAQKRYQIDKIPKPKFCFVHLGFEAKLKSLHVIENLRQAGIRLLHALTRDKLSSQLSLAEHHNLNYVIMMGQKEALEDTVVIRDMKTRTQEIVPVSGLVQFFKNWRPS